MTKIKIIILSCMCLLFVCVFGIGKTYAYTLQDDGNLKSDNLLSLAVGTYTADGIKVVVDSDGSIRFDGQRTSGENYVRIYIPLNHPIDVGTYTSCDIDTEPFINLDQGFIYCPYQPRLTYNDTSVDGISFAGATWTTTSPLKYVCLRFALTEYHGTIYPMLVSGSTLPTKFEPYGTWVSERRYDTLNEEYILLLGENEELYNERNELESNYNKLQQEYDNLRQDYNLLQSDFYDYQEDYGILHDEYTLLQNEYDKLYYSYNILNQYSLYGWGTYIDFLDVSFLDTPGSVITYTRDDLIEKNYLTTTGTLNLSTLAYKDNINYGQVVININFVNNALTSTLLDIAYTGGGSADLLFIIVDNDGNSKNIDFNNSTVINYNTINDILTGSLIESISIKGSSPEAFTSISLKGNGGQLYNNGYDSGKKDGYTSGYDDGNKVGYDSGKKDGYTSGYNEGNKAGYDEGHEIGYDKGYNAGVADENPVTFASMIFAFADIPVSIISQVFGFELFGTNLFVALCSIVSLLLVIWVIRKFI